MSEEIPCPECGRILVEEHETSPFDGKDATTFHCTGLDCLSIFEEDELR